MKRVLVVAPNWIGDCLMATPALRALKQNLKSPYIGILTHPRVRDIFKNNPNVDEIIEFNGGSSIFFKLRLISRLGEIKFDTAFILKPSFTKSLICKLSGIKDIYGHKSRKITFINRFAENSSQEVHKMDYYLSIVRSLGFEAAKKESEFFLTEGEIDEAGPLLRDIPRARFRIILHPKANWSLKEWPKESFAKLADKLTGELDAAVVITGTSQDLELACKIEKLMFNKPYILAGKTSLGELAALIRSADLFISADTGIMHLAASMHTPLIALFGPTHPSISGPRADSIIRIIYNDIGCKVPCYRLDCSDNACMKNISVDDVFEEAKEILSNQQLTRQA